MLGNNKYISPKFISVNPSIGSSKFSNKFSTKIKATVEPKWYEKNVHYNISKSLNKNENLKEKINLAEELAEIYLKENKEIKIAKENGIEINYLEKIKENERNNFKNILILFSFLNKNAQKENLNLAVDAIKSLNLLEKLKLENREFIELTKNLKNNYEDEINKLENELFNSKNNEKLNDYSIKMKKLNLSSIYFIKYVNLNEKLIELFKNKEEKELNKENILEKLNNLINEINKYKKFFLAFNNPKNVDNSNFYEESINAKNNLKNNLEKELMSVEEGLNYVKKIVIETDNFALYKNLNTKDN
uniref:Uncharacterized protein n=1 Tax=Meloidogyne hapla TaxID=6305 RepID=A0A1I8BER8_MELHA